MVRTMVDCRERMPKPHIGCRGCQHPLDQHRYARLERIGPHINHPFCQPGTIAAASEELARRHAFVIAIARYCPPSGEKMAGRGRRTEPVQVVGKTELVQRAPRLVLAISQLYQHRIHGDTRQDALMCVSLQLRCRARRVATAITKPVPGCDGAAGTEPETMLLYQRPDAMLPRGDPGPTIFEEGT